MEFTGLEKTRAKWLLDESTEERGSSVPVGKSSRLIGISSGQGKACLREGRGWSQGDGVSGDVSEASLSFGSALSREVAEEPPLKAQEVEDDQVDCDNDTERSEDGGALDFDLPTADDDEESDWRFDQEDCMSESSVDDSDLDDLLMGVSTEDRDLEKSAVLRARRRRKRKRKKSEPYSQRTTKKKPKKKTAATPSEMTPELEKLMQRANDAYLERDFPTAISLFEEIVRQGPGLHDPFHMLGLIYELEYNNKQKALDYYLLAAHLIPGDAALWKRLGQMSEDFDKTEQAIYCYRRCLKNCGNQLDEAVCFQLAVSYIGKNDYARAATNLKMLFDLHPNDAFLGRQLAVCLYRLRNLEGAVEVLETCIGATPSLESTDPHCLNVLSELYIETGQHDTCLELLRSVLGDGALETLPLDLVVRRAVAEIHTGNMGTCPSVRRLLQQCSETSDVYWDLHVLLGEAFFARQQYTDALDHFLLLTGVKQMATDASLWIKAAKCHLKLGAPEAAVDALERCVRAHDAFHNRTAGIKDAEVRLLLCEVLTNIGRFEDADQVLLTVSYKDLRDGDTLPKPFENDEREACLKDLCSRADVIRKECPSFHISGRVPLAINNPHAGWHSSQMRERAPALRAKATLWTNQFLTLAKESELDTQRVFRQAVQKKVQIAQDPSLEVFINQRPDPETTANLAMPDRSLLNMQHRANAALRRKDPTKIVQFNRVKQEMGLKSLEDFLGWESYGDYLEFGCNMLRGMGRHKEAVELLETVLSNKRRDRTQILDSEKRRFKRRLQRLSLRLSIEGGLSRMALLHVRMRYMRDPSCGTRALDAMSRLLFSGVMAHQALQPLSVAQGREVLLENRSWVIRQVLQNPRSYPLLMLVGHFCSLSNRWPFAVAEYTRAHQMLPHDSLTCLCLAVAYLNFATSRAVHDRHAVVLRAFSFMSRFLHLRSDASAALAWSENERRLYEAENLYNLARAFHLLSLVHLSIPLYLRCLAMLKQCCTASHSLSDKTDTLEFDDGFSLDARQLLVCTAYNLQRIWTAQGSIEQARALGHRYIVWD